LRLRSSGLIFGFTSISFIRPVTLPGCGVSPALRRETDFDG
jgi:hypothetical protein